jgi:hypothetical protein
MNNYLLERKTFFGTWTAGNLPKIQFLHDYLIIDVIATSLSIADEAALKRCTLTHYETAVGRIYDSNVNLNEGCFTNGIRPVDYAWNFFSAFDGSTTYRITVVALVKTA